MTVNYSLLRAVVLGCNRVVSPPASFWWSLLFIVVGLSGVLLGECVREQVSRDLWCEGEGAHEVLAKTRSLWLMARYRLDLKPGGLSGIGLSGRFIDGDTREEIGEIHRQSVFRMDQNNSRLHIDVVGSNKSDTEGSSPEWFNSLGMFIFQPKSDLSFKIQSVGSTRYLIDDGSGFFMLCTRR